MSVTTNDAASASTKNGASFTVELEHFAATNPYRDLPSDPHVHNTIAELHLIAELLKCMFPTTIPGDDFLRYSTFIRNLETRKDLTWMLLWESEVQTALRLLANRGGRRGPLLEEPYDLQRRILRLHRYWIDLSLKPEMPDRWQAAFDTTIIPPLVNEQPPELDFTQDEEMLKKCLYRRYRQSRDRNVSYLKLHPPKPIAFARVRSVDGSSTTPVYKPIYGTYRTEHVPLLWKNTDAPEEDLDADMSDAMLRVVSWKEDQKARRKRQSDWQSENTP